MSKKNKTNGYIWAPYVPLQITNLNDSKQYPTITLSTEKTTYNISIGQKIKFIQTYVKFDWATPTFTSLYPTDPDYEKRIELDAIFHFNVNDEMFVANISDHLGFENCYMVEFIRIGDYNVPRVRFDNKTLIDLFQQSTIEILHDT